MEQVLIIDDDIALCEALTAYFCEEGLRVESIHDGQEGLRNAVENSPDLVVLDITLPDMNGFDLLRELRKESDTPVIIASGRGGQVDRIVGLELGADDYLQKPFDPRELLARVRAILRRAGHGSGTQASSNRTVEVGDVVLHPGSRLVFSGGRPVELTSVEFNLLEILLRRAGRFVSREELTSAVLGRAVYPYDRGIDVHISKLRKKLGHETGGVERIRTIRNVGYLYSLPPASQKAAGGGRQRAL
jgi:DNA-binding response OmpR family regulator